MLLFVHVKHDYLYDVADRDGLARMADKFIADLRYMHKPVLVNADIDKNAEIYNVAHATHKLHAGLEILYFENVLPEQHGRQLVTRIAPRLHKLCHDIVERRHADAAVRRRLFLAYELYL